MPAQLDQLQDYLYKLLLSLQQSGEERSATNQKMTQYAMLDKLQQQLGIQKEEQLYGPGGVRRGFSLAEAAAKNYEKGDWGVAHNINQLASISGTPTGHDLDATGALADAMFRAVASLQSVYEGRDYTPAAGAVGLVPEETGRGARESYGRNVVSPSEEASLALGWAKVRGDAASLSAEPLRQHIAYVTDKVKNIRDIRDLMARDHEAALGVFISMAENNFDDLDKEETTLLKKLGVNTKEQWAEIIAPKFTLELAQRIDDVGRVVMPHTDEKTGMQVPGRLLTKREMQFMAKTENVFTMYKEYESARIGALKQLETIHKRWASGNITPDQDPQGAYEALAMVYERIAREQGADYAGYDIKANEALDQAVWDYLINGEISDEELAQAFGVTLEGVKITSGTSGGSKNAGQSGPRPT